MPGADDAAPACPVCRSGPAVRFLDVAQRRYWRCGRCAATFLDPAQHPDRATERAHYLTHENDPDDARYRRFLGRLATPLLARLAPGSSGLDYGCGPGPALAAMLREAGHDMTLYDPIFAPDEEALRRRYDFVVLSEVAEHFHRPVDEFDRLGRLVRPGGWIGVMTAFQTDDARFAGWRYRRDPTHVVFYRPQTLLRIARDRGWTCAIPGPDVALLRTADGDQPAASRAGSSE